MIEIEVLKSTSTEKYTVQIQPVSTTYYSTVTVLLIGQTDWYQLVAY